MLIKILDHFLQHIQFIPLKNHSQLLQVLFDNREISDVQILKLKH